MEAGTDAEAEGGPEEDSEEAEGEAAPAEAGMADAAPEYGAAATRAGVTEGSADPSQVEGVPERVEPLPAADDPKGNRRRSRRGPRRRRAEETLPEVAALDAEQPYLPPYNGPTPADPFGGGAFVFEALERTEAEAAPPPPALPRVIGPDDASEADAPEAGEAAHDPGEAASPPTPANDLPPLEPAIQPIVVDATTAPPAERKRGWWRR